MSSEMNNFKEKLTKELLRLKMVTEKLNSQRQDLLIGIKVSRSFKMQ